MVVDANATYAFHVVVEFLDGLEVCYDDMGGSDDIEHSDFFEDLRDTDWVSLVWYDEVAQEEVWRYERPLTCKHKSRALTDETIAGCEYTCTACGHIKFRKNRAIL